MDNLFQEFLREKLYLKNLSPKTKKSYGEAFKWFRGSELSKQGLSSFVVKMREGGLSPVTCNIYIRSMNSFLSWLNENGHIREPLKMKQLKEEKRVKQGYNDEELSRLLSFKPRTFYEWRLYALICLLADTGIRIEEALTIDVHKVDFDNLLIRVNGKGSKERIIPISIELRKILFRYIQQNKCSIVFHTRSGGRLSYRNILRDFERLCHKVGVPYKSFHYLRRTFARHYITNGGSLFHLQRVLGHESITTTQRYVYLNVEDLQETHRKTSILSRLR